MQFSSFAQRAAKRAIYLVSVAEDHAARHDLAWRSISTDSAGRVTIYGQRFEVLAVVGEIA